MSSMKSSKEERPQLSPLRVAMWRDGLRTGTLRATRKCKQLECLSQRLESKGLNLRALKQRIAGSKSKRAELAVNWNFFIALKSVQNSHTNTIKFKEN